MFHGWKVVGVCALGNALAMGMGTLNFGLFIHPMGSDLGASRADFGWASTLRQYLGAATSPYLGGLIDKHGSRWLLAGAMLVAGLCLIGVSFATQSWHMIALFAVMGVVGVIGPGQLLTTVPVMRWFVTRRAKAVAVMSIGVPVGALVFMPLTQYLLDEVGWRLTWQIIGALVILLMVPASIAWLRRAPEDLGLRPDGLTAQEAAAEPEEFSWTRAAAIRTPVYWQLIIVVSLIAFAIGTIALHRIPAFVDRGIDPVMIAWATALDAVLAGAGTFLFGMFGHRVPSRIFGAIGFSLLALGCGLMVYTETTAMLFFSMSVWGLGVGGMLYMQNIIWAEYFGREHVGAIRGFGMPITLVLGGIGAPFAGYAFDWFGSYIPVWWGSVVLLLIGAVVILLSRPPTPVIAD